MFIQLFIALILLFPLVEAKSYSTYLPNYDSIADYRERLDYPHIYLQGTVVTKDRFLEDPMHPGSSTVRWTSEGSYSINLDKIHVMRGSYTLIIKSKSGPDIRLLPFETTKIYLKPDYFKITYDKETYTVWLARYAD